jgi:Tfp pilus assembly major pilin PilA
MKSPDISHIQQRGTQMYCEKCGKLNDDTDTFCAACGSALPQAVIDVQLAPAAVAVPVDPEAHYKAVIGPKNQDYYLRYFLRFDGKGSIGASWHWPAFFVSFYWLLYRKMWLGAFLYFVLAYIAPIPLVLAANMAGDSAAIGIVVAVALLLLLIATYLVPPIYANALYYKLCKNKIANAISSSPDLKLQIGELSKKGGTSIAPWIFLLIGAVLGFIGIVAAIALPVYQDYTTRARLVAAVDLGKSAADSVVGYFYKNQQIPSTLQQAGFAAPASTTVKEISVNGQNGVVTVTMADEPISGKSFLWVPSVDSDKKIIWTCMSQEIPDKYLPRQCRQ